MNTTEQRIEAFFEIMRDITLSDGFMEWLTASGYFTAPASSRFHGAYKGGLFDHSYSVTQMLVQMTERMPLEWDDPRSPRLVGMFHDLCKIAQYKLGPEINPSHPQHGESSVWLLSQWYTLTSEETLCIRHHMGAYEVKQWYAFDQAIKKCPNTLWTHTADMYASKVRGL